MKKSTLFFKVMVLLALLVPWTAWGHDRDRLAPKDPPKHESWYIRGYKSITLTSEGKIPNENDQKYKNISLSEVNPAWKLSLLGWSFDSENKSAIISPSNSGVTASVTGSDKSIHISGTPTVDAIYVRVESEHQNQKGWIKITFNAKKPEDVSKSLDISYTNREGQKIYDGKEISDDDVRKGLTVKAGDVTFDEKEDYTVEVVNNSANVGKYAVKVTITKKGYEGSGKKENAYEITPKELTVTIKDQTKTLPGGKIETDASQWAEIKDKETAIISDDKVSLTGKIKEGEEGKLVADGDITTSNTNYTVKRVEPGDLTVKYNLTDDNWDEVLDVTLGTEGDGVYTYNGKTHEASITGELADKFEIVYKDAQGNKVEGKPLHAGDYNIYIVEKGEGDDNITIPEGGINTKKKITIKAAEITLTGSVTVEQGALLKTEYAVADLDKQNVFGTDDASSKLIEEFGLTFEGKVTPLVDLDLNKVGTTDHAFYIKNATEGTWLINIQESTSENYQLGDITIKDIEIKLIVTEKEVDWTDESNQQKEVTVYVNEEGQLKYGEDGEYSTSVDITLNGISELAGWSFVLEENPEEDFDVLAVMSGDEVVMEGLSWATLITTDKVINGLQVSFENKNSIYESLTESKSVKVRLEKDGADGYLLITFKQGESTEEPGGDDEDMTWAEDGNKKASITVYVDKSSGQPLKSEPAMDSKDFAIDLAKFEELEGEWSFATTDDNAIIDKDLSALYSFGVFKGDLLLEPKSEFNSESLSSVKVKIENGDNVGYLEINFKTITVIAEDDINKGGDDDNNNDQIDDDETTFVGDATGGKYVIYDGLPHGLGMLEITVDDETKVLKETDGAYDVVYGESEEEPVDAGTYSATITFNEAMGYSGTVTLTNSVVIAQRPITLYFSFEEGILEGEEFVLGENVFIDVKEGSFAEGEKAEFDELIEKGIISAKFALGETQSDGTVEVKLVSFNYPAGEVSGYDLKYSNYDPKLLTGHVKEHGKGGTETELPDAGEAGEDGTIDYPGEGGSEIIVGDVDIIDEETGIGGSGINYRQYELKFCETDFFHDLNDYEADGLKLFSRHNKFYTKANGSFTIWYEKDGVKNGEYGDYRIYISRNGADGDYSELKLDEVSDYFQIRNVNSDIWVRIYYGTGFPVANEEITATDARAYAQANKIVVITPEPTDVQIISMAGAVVATDQVTGQREFANLAEGFYIVCMGETVIKLQVRN